MRYWNQGSYSYWKDANAYTLATRKQLDRYSGQQVDYQGRYYMEERRKTQRKPVVFLIHGMSDGKSPASVDRLGPVYERRGYEVVYVKWDEKQGLLGRTSWTVWANSAGKHVWNAMGDDYNRYANEGRDITVIGHSNGGRAVNWLANHGYLDDSRNYAINSGFDGKNASNVTHVKEHADLLSMWNKYDVNLNRPHNMPDGTSWYDYPNSNAHSVDQPEIDYFTSEANRYHYQNEWVATGRIGAMIANYSEKDWFPQAYDNAMQKGRI